MLARHLIIVSRGLTCVGPRGASAPKLTATAIVNAARMTAAQLPVCQSGSAANNSSWCYVLALP